MGKQGHAYKLGEANALGYLPWSPRTNDHARSTTAACRNRLPAHQESYIAPYIRRLVAHLRDLAGIERVLTVD